MGRCGGLWPLAVGCAVIASVDAVRVISDEVMGFEPIMLPRHTLRRARGIGRLGDRNLNLPLFADGKNWTLALVPAKDLIAPDAVMGNGMPFSSQGYYEGFIVSAQESSQVHVHINEDGHVMGFFDDGREKYFIRPAHEVDGGDVDGGNHVVYKQSQVIHDDFLKKFGCSAHGEYDTAMTEEQQSQRSRRTTATQAGPFVTGRKVCRLAMYMDATFITHYGASTALNLVMEMLAIANGVFSTTSFTQGLSFKHSVVFIDWATSGSSSSTQIEALLAQAPAGNVQRFLEQFSKFDWGTVCLAHLFTHTDFSGTLGLAWTGYPDSENHNGGICQARYNSGGSGLSLNSAWTSSLNFGAQQPVAQTALVLTHELGHNWGSLHDPDLGSNIPPDGVYVMYAFANQGTKANNDNFSPTSVARISSVIADRAACFVDSADPECGNGLIESNATSATDFAGYEEICDGGAVGTTDTCCVSGLSGSQCISAAAALKPGMFCSPRSSVFGQCCNTDCSWKSNTTVCGAESECQHSGVCTVRGGAQVHPGMLGCLDGTVKNNTLSCEQGVILGVGSRGSSVCDRGSCNRSICSLITIGGAPLQSCEGLTGESACAIQCKLGANGTCTRIGSITGLDAPTTYLVTSADKYNPSTRTLNATELTGYSKPAGGKCNFLSGQPESGLCDRGGKCVEADGEADSLAELRAQYSKYQRLFTDWALEPAGGIPKFGWLIIGALIILAACISGCYFANKPDIQEMRERRKSGRGVAPANQKMRRFDA